MADEENQQEVPETVEPEVPEEAPEDVQQGEEAVEVPEGEEAVESPQVDPEESPEEATKSPDPSRITVSGSEAGRFVNLVGAEALPEVLLNDRLGTVQERLEADEETRHSIRFSEVKRARAVIPSETVEDIEKEDTRLGKAFRKARPSTRSSTSSLEKTSRPSMSTVFEARSQLPSEIGLKEFAIKGQSLIRLMENAVSSSQRSVLSVDQKLEEAKENPEEDVRVKGNDLHELVKIMSESRLRSMIRTPGTLSTALREVMRSQKPFEKPEEPPNEYVIAAEKAQRTIEDMNDKIRTLKEYLNVYIRKECKTSEDRKRIKLLQCELKQASECQKQLVEEVVRLQKRARGHGFKPIMLSTTITEDHIPSLYSRKKTPKPMEGGSSMRFQEAICEDNLALSTERCQLQRQVLDRDRIVENLQAQIHIMTQEITKLNHDNIKMTREICCSKKSKPSPDIQARLESYRENTAVLEENILKMSLALNELQMDLNGVQRDRETCKEIQSRRPCTAEPQGRRSEALRQENQDLKMQYKQLVQEYNRKERESRDLRECLERKKTQDETFTCKSPEAMELELLKKKYEELLDEQEEYGVIIKEQRRQVEEYCEKYMTAQQEVEEQRRQMGNMEMNNEKIQEQVNLEVHRIKCKFQEKLRELTPFPKMLENEQIRSHDLCLRVKTLEAQLKEAERDLRAAEMRVKELEKLYSESNVVIIEGLRDQVEKLEDKIDQLKLENTRMEQNYLDERDRFDALRGETARIIAKNNERAESTRYVQLDRIGQLEKELAKVRADASCDLAMKEKTISKVEGKMRLLAGNFEDAQDQIRQLQGHIAYLTSPGKKSRSSDCGSFSSSCT